MLGFILFIALGNSAQKAVAAPKAATTTEENEKALFVVYYNKYLDET